MHRSDNCYRIWTYTLTWEQVSITTNTIFWWWASFPRSHVLPHLWGWRALLLKVLQVHVQHLQLSQANYIHCSTSIISMQGSAWNVANFQLKSSLQYITNTNGCHSILWSNCIKSIRPGNYMQQHPHPLPHRVMQSRSGLTWLFFFGGGGGGHPGRRNRPPHFPTWSGKNKIASTGVLSASRNLRRDQPQLSRYANYLIANVNIYTWKTAMQVCAFLQSQ